MKPIFIVTGANGHLGNTLVRLLKQQNQEVRGLILPGEKAQNTPLVHYYHADVCKKESLRALFANTHMRDVYVIHTAGIVDISPKVLPKVYDVNVTGTQNVIDLCREYGVKRLVYVSSVHAIPEQGKNKITSEIQNFSPHNVVGGYAKTKAQATQAVLHACRQGLDAVVVQPSGILGPYDSSGNHLVQLVKDYLAGRLPACVKGGYDFVDVRDVALGCLQAAYKGKSGECYILSNRRYQIHEVLEMVRRYAGGKKL